MKFCLISSVLLSLSNLSLAAATLLCSEASRFGGISVSPTTVSAGDDISVFVNLTCAIEYYGIVPKYLDYTISVPAELNNGHEPNIVLARRTFDASAGATFDKFTAQIPYYPYFSGAAYEIQYTNTYPVTGSDGTSQVLIQGGVSASITINTFS